MKTAPTPVRTVSISYVGETVKNLASKVGLKTKDLRSKLMELGESVGKDDEIAMVEADVAELVVLEMGLDVTREKSDGEIDAEMLAKAKRKNTTDLVARAPVVCVMGHVDHGKTTLLDTLRKANVADGEAGGITQRLSAFSVEAATNRSVVFLDTPGHAAFSAMRANGATATDLVILVVAIDDGVRPQTKEAVEIAKNAGCTILIALNKVDKLTTEKERKKGRMRVLGELTECDLIAEELGGDVQVVEVSGKTGVGLPDLIEALQLQADVLELEASVKVSRYIT